MTKNTKLLLTVVAVMAAAGAYWMLLLGPKRQQLADLDNQVAAAKTELGQSQALLKTYEQARGEYRTNYATVVRLGKAVPSDDDVRSLVVQLDSAAERSGVDFGRISIGEGSGSTTEQAAGATPPPPGAVSVGPAGFHAMPFTFGFEGQFDNLSTFFSRLERFVTVSNERIDVTGRLLRLESLKLAPRAGGAISAEIGASSYLLPSTQSVTGGGTATAPAAGTTTAAAPQPGSGTTTPPTTTATSTGALR